MPNAVYILTVQLLTELLPESSAALLEKAMREYGLTPENVTTTQMRDVLTRQQADSPQDAEVWRAVSERLDTLKEGEVSLEASSFESDDFEFDDPEYSAAPGRPTYLLDAPAGQDALIRDLGRLAGVQGVLVTRENGEILRSKALRDASGLGSVIAATAALFRRQGLRLLSAELGTQTVCMRPAHGYCVAVVAGANVNTGRLLAELERAELRLSSHN